MSDSITLNSILFDQLSKDNLANSFDARQMRVLHNLALCGTEYFGFTKTECEQCGHTEIHYGTCSDSNCPTCGHARRSSWIEEQKKKALNVPMFHVVFTCPDKHLNSLALHDPRYFYSALFKASSWAVNRLSREPKYFGAEVPGYISFLHTWGSALVVHPHIHMIFYGGGLDENQELVLNKNGEKFLFPAKELAALFKKKMMKLLKKEYGKSEEWKPKLQEAEYVSWNVQILPGKAGYLLSYIGRYVNRTAISNSRIKAYDGETVTFEYKDYRDHGSRKTEDGKADRGAYTKKQMTLLAEEFIRRFSLHILPKGFRKSRFYGFLAPGKMDSLEKMKELAGVPELKEQTAECETNDGSGEERAKERAGQCSECKGRMVLVLRQERVRGKKISQSDYLKKLRKEKEKAGKQSITD